MFFPKLSMMVENYKIITNYTDLYGHIREIMANQFYRMLWNVQVVLMNPYSSRAKVYEVMLIEKNRISWNTHYNYVKYVSIRTRIKIRRSI